MGPPDAAAPMAVAMPSVRDAKLTVKQESLLLSLERRVQLRVQAERNASLRLAPKTTAAGEYAASVKDFLRQNMHHLGRASASPEQGATHDGFRAFAAQVDGCVDEWRALYDHAHQSFGLVEEMETSHEHVVSKTQALYDSFETILHQVEALTTRVELIASPLPHFVAIDGIARTLGFGVKFATPSSTNAGTGTGTGTANANGNAVNMTNTSAASYVQQPVQVFQHKRSIDPTTPAFQHALEQIDRSVAYLEDHREFKDSVCYIEAYRTLTAGAIQCLKDYAISGLDAARDAVLDAVAKAKPSAALDIDETSPYYVHFQLVAPSLTAVATQLARLASSNSEAANQTSYMANVQALADVCNAYATQRVSLLSPVLTNYFESMSQGTDIVNLLRVSGAYLVRVCEAEFRLYLKLFGREPSDDLFVFKTHRDDDDDEDETTAFERMIFQLSGILYNLVRPQMLFQKELESLCEIVQVLQSELIESVITPRAHVVGYVEPVMHRMIQDAQERLILCVQKFIRDEIEGFSPTPSDLDYPNKLQTDQATTSGANLYATWYPALEHTLLCLSKVYHFVNMEIFEELAQDAIQICTASLKMASADLTVAKGAIHGSLFLVKHLLTLREQITPFDIKFSVRAKALDFTSSADAMSHLLSDVSSMFSFSLESNALVGLFTQGIPQIHETTSDVKKDVEQELKKSCTSFIDAALQQLAQPLLSLMKQIAALQTKHNPVARGASPLDLTHHAFTKPEAVAKILAIVDKNVATSLPVVRETIHLYLRNASTEAILFKPIQKNLVDAVENLRTLMEQNYSHDERAPCQAVFESLLQQLTGM